MGAIDFDQKAIIDNNGWGPSTRVLYDWLEESVEDATEGQEGLVPSASLIEHFRVGRIRLQAMPNPPGDCLRFDNLDTALTQLKRLKEDTFDARRPLSFAHIELPETWKLVRVKG